jgi:hypothetical protein
LLVHCNGFFLIFHVARAQTVTTTVTTTSIQRARRSQLVG